MHTVRQAYLLTDSGIHTYKDIHAEREAYRDIQSAYRIDTYTHTYIHTETDLRTRIHTSIHTCIHIYIQRDLAVHTDP